MLINYKTMVQQTFAFSLIAEDVTQNKTLGSIIVLSTFIKYLTA